MQANQRGEPIVENQLFCDNREHTDEQRNGAIALLCEYLGVAIVETNATESGNLQLQLRRLDHA